MTPEQRIAALGKIADEIKALEADHLSFMATFRTRSTAIEAKIQKVMTEQVTPVGQPRVKRTYKARKPKEDPPASAEATYSTPIIPKSP